MELCDRLSNPLIEVDAVDEETPTPLPDYHVLRPGKPTTNTVWTAADDYTWFEAFSEEGCATCTPAPHMQSKRKTEGAKDDRDIHSFGRP